MDSSLTTPKPKFLVLSRLLLPMPCTTLCWFALAEVADQLAHGSQPVAGTGPSFSGAMLVAAFIFSLFLGALLQLFIGLPTTRRLRARQAPVSAYCRAGAWVGLSVLALPAGCFIVGAPVRELFSIWSLSVAAIIVLPAVLCYAITGMIENRSVSTTLPNDE